MTDSEFLNWIADRFVNVHNESPNVDFVSRLRSLASKLRTRREIIRDAARRRDQMLEMRKEGKTHEAIAKHFGMSSSAVYYTLYPERRSYSKNDPRYDAGNKT